MSNKTIQGLTFLAICWPSVPLWSLESNNALGPSPLTQLAPGEALWSALALALVLVLAYGVSWAVGRPMAQSSDEEEHLRDLQGEHWYMSRALDLMPEEILLTDAEGRILLANKALRKSAALLGGQLSVDDDLRTAIDRAQASQRPTRQVVQLPGDGAREVQLTPICQAGSALGMLVRFRPLVSQDTVQLHCPGADGSYALRIDQRRRRADLDDERLDLTTTEFDLLSYLVECQGEIQTREVLLRQVWGHSHPAHSRTVDTHIRRLREKLGPASAAIATVRGSGYRFEAANARSISPC